MGWPPLATLLTACGVTAMSIVDGRISVGLISRNVINCLRKTYYARHAKYSDGNDHPCFGGLVTVPPKWDKGRNEKVLPKRKKKKKEKESSIAATASPKATPTKRIWDFESSQFVELITIED